MDQLLSSEQESSSMRPMDVYRGYWSNETFELYKKYQLVALAGDIARKQLAGEFCIQHIEVKYSLLLISKNIITSSANDFIGPGELLQQELDRLHYVHICHRGVTHGQDNHCIYWYPNDIVKLMTDPQKIIDDLQQRVSQLESMLHQNSKDDGNDK